MQWRNQEKGQGAGGGSSLSGMVRIGFSENVVRGVLIVPRCGEKTFQAQGTVSGEAWSLRACRPA